jgi:hypothetical protein
MKPQRVAALFDDRATADRVKTALVDAGVNPTNVRVHAGTSLEGVFRTGDANLDADAGRDHGVVAFFRELFGFGEKADVAQANDAAHHARAEALRRGAALVVVDAVDSHEADRSVSVIQTFAPLDIDQEAARWREAGWTSYDPHAPAFDDEEAMAERARRRAARGR